MNELVPHHARSVRHLAVFADASLEACAGRYRAYGAGEVVVKNGGGPVCAFADGRMVAIDGLDRVEPLDSTGAGDAFNGAYLAARLSGDSAADAIRKAHVLAARVVRHPGALLPPEALA